MAVLISYLQKVLFVISDNPSEYGMTANLLLPFVDLLLFFVTFIFFSFSDIDHAIRLGEGKL